VSQRVVEWVRRVHRPEDVPHTVAEHTLRGEAIPGFGHPLYPDGDPRTAPLLAVAQTLAGSSRALAVVRALVSAMQRQRRERPNVDLGLAALGLAIGVPDVAPSAIFAVGRCGGWIAHVLEQRRAGFLLRPRAVAVTAR
jgi:citrate synthase